MKNFFQAKVMSYYWKIGILLLTLLLLVMIPFAGITIALAKSRIMNNINQTNSMVLRQIKSNYAYVTKSMASVCLTTYFRSDIQPLLYNEDLEYDNIYPTVQELKNDVLQMQPSIFSIAIYNVKRNELYSTTTGGLADDEDLTEFIKSQKNVPKLVPLLRTIRTDAGNRYVFSYFMYDYSNPSTGESSYLVINQNADWFVDAIANGAGKDEKSRVLLAGDSGEIYHYQNEGDYGQDDKYLVQRCMQKKRNSKQDASKMGFYTDSYQNKKYLISYMDFGNNGNTIVMFEDYDKSFSTIRRMEAEFAIVSLVFAIFALIMVFVLARHICRPVDKLLNYVSDLDEADTVKETETDEFEHLKSIYSRIKATNVKLKMQKESSANIVQRYFLNNLLRDYDEETFRRYCRQLPQEMLVRAKELNLYVVLFHIDGVDHNKFQFVEEDEDILLYALENIFCEMSAGKYGLEVTRDRPMELALIINMEQTGPDDRKEILDLIRELQLFAKAHLDISVSAAFSGVGKSIDELTKLYAQTQAFLKYRIIYGKGSLLDNETCAQNINNATALYSRELRKRLEERLKLGNMEKINETLKQIKDEICKLRYENIIINIMDLLTTINLCIDKINSTRNEPVSINFSEMYRNVIEEEYIDELFEKLPEYISSILSGTQDSTEKQDSKNQVFVNTVVKYVNTHYLNYSLSSQEIAQYLGISDQYAAKKFKQCTGIPLGDYIMSIRMKNAARLLTSTNMSVNKIAENVGMDNDNYFYHLFKKTYGCTPREFSDRAKSQI